MTCTVHCYMIHLFRRVCFSDALFAGWLCIENENDAFKVRLAQKTLTCLGRLNKYTRNETKLKRSTSRWVYWLVSRWNKLEIVFFQGFILHLWYITLDLSADGVCILQLTWLKGDKRKTNHTVDKQTTLNRIYEAMLFSTFMCSIWRHNVYPVSGMIGFICMYIQREYTGSLFPVCCGGLGIHPHITHFTNRCSSETNVGE